MTTIGIIGAGHIGSQIARLAVENGYNVVISNSRGPETLSALIAELGPKAHAATAVEAAKAGDIVVVSVPLKNYRKVPVEPLAGKIVIDTDNYYPERDGHIPELDNESITTSELLQAHLPTSKVVKAFNHIYAAALTTDGQPAGAKKRRALVIAGDDIDAKARGDPFARPVRLRYGRRRPAERGVAYPARHPRLRSAPNGRGSAPGSGGGQAVCGSVASSTNADRPP
jgi:8-hydroxy-5-deazaflavin:NADPH oxidoreductase